MIFCTDVDLLHWEPGIFAEAAFASQVLGSGTGTLAGTRFTVSSGSLAGAHVAAGQVIVLGGSVAGSYPIVSVDSDTQMTLSVLYDGLYGSEGEPAASPVGSAEGLTYAVRTFGPQRRVVSDLLLRVAGAEESADALPRVANPQSLRRACVLGTLQMIYNALAAAATEPSRHATRADLYERLYRRALREAKVELDTDGDGKGDLARQLNVVELLRV